MTKQAARDLVLLIGSLAETTTPDQLTDRARDDFAGTFGSAALDNGLTAKAYDEIQTAYTSGYLHGYSAAVADLAMAAAVKYAGADQ
jgi:hypothetical protein